MKTWYMGENKRKHLEFIQLTITRMNVNSFMLKGWLVTIVAALFVLFNEGKNIEVLAYFCPLVSILFWILDAFFISTERGYRDLYDHVRLLKEGKIDFSMDYKSHSKKGSGFTTSLFSSTLLLFYPLLICVSIFIAKSI